MTFLNPVTALPKGGFIVPVLNVRVLSNTNKLVNAHPFLIQERIEKYKESIKYFSCLDGCSSTFNIGTMNPLLGVLAD